MFLQFLLLFEKPLSMNCSKSLKYYHNWEIDKSAKTPFLYPLTHFKYAYYRNYREKRVEKPPFKGPRCFGQWSACHIFLLITSTAAAREIKEEYLWKVRMARLKTVHNLFFTRPQQNEAKISPEKNKKALKRMDSQKACPFSLVLFFFFFKG